MSLVSPLGLYDKHTIKSDELVSTSDLVKFVKLVKLVRLVELDQLFDLIRVLPDQKESLSNFISASKHRQ